MATASISSSCFFHLIVLPPRLGILGRAGAGRKPYDRQHHKSRHGREATHRQPTLVRYRVRSEYAMVRITRQRRVFAFTLSGLQSRFGVKPLKFQVVCPPKRDCGPKTVNTGAILSEASHLRISNSICLVKIPGTWYKLLARGAIARVRYLT